MAKLTPSRVCSILPVVPTQWGSRHALLVTRFTRWPESRLRSAAGLISRDYAPPLGIANLIRFPAVGSIPMLSKFSSSTRLQPARASSRTIPSTASLRTIPTTSTPAWTKTSAQETKCLAESVSPTISTSFLAHFSARRTEVHSTRGLSKTSTSTAGSVRPTHSARR